MKLANLILREERPDIDAIYQSALALMGEHGGWPLTMFLTPDGEPFWGGTYFPQPVFFRFLWRAYKRTESPMFKDAVTTSIIAMCQGGMYDHLGGGFARYSTDERWLVPHFEKPLMHMVPVASFGHQILRLRLGC